MKEIREHGSFDAEEWRPFIVCRGLERLGDRLDGTLRREAALAIRRFVEEELKQPFFFTAPNHEMWKLLVAALAGRVLKRPAWRKQAEFEILQLLRYQTPEGFWEEGRHHGPSMAYNFTMLTPLALLARELGHSAMLDSATRLARFMTTWMFPDGLRTAALDGRIGLGWARFTAGLSAAMFVRAIPYQYLSREGLELLAPNAVTLARTEGLEAHARSIEIRLK
jgi:hypothetical protein